MTERLLSGFEFNTAKGSSGSRLCGNSGRCPDFEKSTSQIAVYATIGARLRVKAPPKTSQS
jgi:hypothetical protein